MFAKQFFAHELRYSSTVCGIDVGEITFSRNSPENAKHVMVTIRGDEIMDMSSHMKLSDRIKNKILTSCDLSKPVDIKIFQPRVRFRDSNLGIANVEFYYDFNQGDTIEKQ